MNGKVYLVGAGPGDPELLTLKALKVLKRADVVLHDDLVSMEILAFVPSTARIQNVGKRCGGKSTSQREINSLLVQYALLGLQVVRLKGGDPFIFGRGGEEMQALRQAGIEVEVVPGITAALSAAAAIQIPLTYREISSSLVFLTGHQSDDAHSDGWPEAIARDATVVIYMPGRDYLATAQKLRAAGLSNERMSQALENFHPRRVCLHRHCWSSARWCASLSTVLSASSFRNLLLVISKHHKAS